MPWFRGFTVECDRETEITGLRDTNVEVVSWKGSCPDWHEHVSLGNLSQRSTSIQANQNVTSVTNDAELLLDRCGSPDVDWATDRDEPRPLIPSRFITYRKPHLRFGYVPNGDSNIADPPYKWKLIGVVDTMTNKAVNADNLKAILARRLPCYLNQ